MQRAYAKLEQVEIEHRARFTRQMHAMGADNLMLDGGYIVGLLAQYQLEYVQALKRLFQRFV